MLRQVARSLVDLLPAGFNFKHSSARSAVFRVVSLTANRHAHMWSVLSFQLSFDHFAPYKQYCLR